MEATIDTIKAFRPQWKVTDCRSYLIIEGTEYRDREGRDWLKSKFRAQWNKRAQHWSVDLNPHSGEDYSCSDMGYEDACAAACGPGL